jgi:hypothetical protein
VCVKFVREKLAQRGGVKDDAEAVHATDSKDHAL